ncbi:MAG: tetratricopeptide repeat protein [Gemmatimonadales bacterium]
MLQQVMTITLLTAMAIIHPMPSQGIPRDASISGASHTAPAPKVTVATPYPANSADSASAVAIGYGLRERLTHNLGSDWQVITANDMNKNLANSGYPKDALLPPEQARALANLLTTRVLVTTSISKNPDSRFVAGTRVIGTADDAGQVVRATQVAGQQLNDFGSKIADQLSVIFKAYNDARVCNDQQTTNRAKAIDAANKAIKAVPNFGYAEYCLGEIAQQKDSASDEALNHFKNAALGDPFSLKAENQLAVIHFKRHDSTAVVADYQQMITIAPTNQPLAQKAIDVFRAYHRPDAAEQVVDAQIKLDPTNPDWFDLKGNSCAAQAAVETDSTKAKPEFQCAYSAFNQEYTLDPSRVDSLLFQKIIFVAQTAADSLKWARLFVQKYPTNASALEAEAELFTAAGQTDSAVALVTMLVKLDSTNTKPMLVVAKALIDAKHEDAALQFAPTVVKSGDDNTKNQYAGLLIIAADSASRRTPQDDSVMAHIGRAVIALAPSNKSLVEFANYFVVRALSDSLQGMSTAVRAQKSCDYVKRYDAVLSELEPALIVITASSNTGISNYGNQLLAPVQSERKTLPQLQQAFCH